MNDYTSNAEKPIYGNLYRKKQKKREGARAGHPGYEGDLQLEDGRYHTHKMNIDTVLAAGAVFLLGRFLDK